MRFNTKKLIRFIQISGVLLTSGTLAQAKAPDLFDVGESVQLMGYTRFSVYSIGEHRYLTTGYDFNFLLCNAVLTFTGEHSFDLHTEEAFIFDPDTVIRTVEMSGHISASGELFFDYPDALAAMQEHIGVIVHGRGVNKDVVTYKGLYNGEIMDAEMHVMGKQVQPAFYPFFWKDPDNSEVLFDAPLYLVFMYQLDVVE